jgi:hypothetical protein
MGLAPSWWPGISLNQPLVFLMENEMVDLGVNLATGLQFELTGGWSREY